MIENCVQMSVFNLLTNSMSVNGQVYDIANRHPGFHKHFICEETLSHSDSPTRDQDISRIKYTRGANFTKLCMRHRETSTSPFIVHITIAIRDSIPRLQSQQFKLDNGTAAGRLLLYISAIVMKLAL